jgi:hypothetical protein
MKPFKVCPGCQGPFKQIVQNKNWHQDLCQNRCDVDFSQFHLTDFDDDTITYQSFYTEDFSVYAYYDSFGYKNLLHIYNRVFPRGQSTHMPIFIIPMFELDFTKLDEYNKRWKLWSILS